MMQAQTVRDDNCYPDLSNRVQTWVSNSRPEVQRTFSNLSDNALHIPSKGSGQSIKRWDGLAREATDWDCIRRDPELFFPNGNCLIYLYAAGVSQRGPSFRIPYRYLLASSCAPLIKQCLVSTLNIAPYRPILSKPPSDDVVDFSVSGEDSYSYLYLYPPAGLSQEESYSYHITTRNFFAWLLSVPLVGTDPVSALLDLKIRMDTWRDTNANNFESLFEFAKRQAYGDFEVTHIEKARSSEAYAKPERKNTTTALHKRATYHDHRFRHDGDKIWRNDSLERLKRSTSTTHIAMQHMRAGRVESVRTSSLNESRKMPPRATSFSDHLPARSVRESNAELEPVAGAQSFQASYQALLVTQPTEAGRRQWRQSTVTPSPTLSPVSPIEGNGLDAALLRLTGSPSSSSVNTISSTAQATKAQKKKNRVSWADNCPTPTEKRVSQTDLTFPTMQGIGWQSVQASSSAMNLGQSGSPALKSYPSLPRAMSSSEIPSMSSSASADRHPKPSNSSIRLSAGVSAGSPNQDDVSGQHHVCNSCGKQRKLNDTTDYSRASGYEARTYQYQSRPVSVRSTKSSRSTKSWRSMKSWRSVKSWSSMKSWNSMKSWTTLSSIRSSLSMKSAKSGMATLNARMQKRRQLFRSRLNKNLKADGSDSVKIPSCNPVDYKTARPPSRKSWARGHHHTNSPPPVELHADSMTVPIAPDTIAELDAAPWGPDSYSSTNYSYSPKTPEESSIDGDLTSTSRIRPIQIFNSNGYQHLDRYGGRTRHMGDLARGMPGILGQEHFDLNNMGMIDTADGFESNIEALLGELEKAGISDRLGGKNKGKAKAHNHKRDSWVSMTSGMGVPRLEVNGLA